MAAPTRMILVEDDPADVYMYRKVMAPYLEGDLHCAGRASQVADALDQHKPHFMVTDMKLPGADGASVVQTVRRREAWRTLPVIVCSTSGLRDDVDRAYEAGANAYIRKPGDLEGWMTLAECLACFWGELNLTPH